MNFVLALIGSWTVVRLVGSVTGRNPWLSTLLVLLAVIILVVFWVRRRIGDYSSLFDRAATRADLARRLHDDSVLGLQNQVAWDLLCRIYFPMMAEVNAGASSGKLHYVLDANGKPFLCAVLVAPPEMGLDDLLHPGIVPAAIDPGAKSFAEARQSFISRLRSEVTFSNPMGDEKGDNLVLTELSSGADKVRIQCSVATYGEIVRTSDALQNEFAIFGFLSLDRSVRRRRTLPSHPADGWIGESSAESGRSLTFTVRDGLRLLPWRHQVHAWSRSPGRLFFQPVGRASGLGVSVAMVSTLGDGEAAFVARRSANVGVYPDALHVVPSGMCNAKSDLRAGSSKLPSDYVKWIMLAELLEECFDLRDMAESRTLDWIAAAQRELRARGLESFEPKLTGLALDLVNLRWDVCARVDMGGEISRDDYKLCWEYSPLQQVRSLRLDLIGAELDRRHMVQAGAGSLALANAGHPLLKSVDNGAHGHGS